MSYASPLNSGQQLGQEALTEMARRSVGLMATGARADFDAVYHPDFCNREASAEPPETRGRGPAAAWATARWLRGSYADLRWTVTQVFGRDDLAVVYASMAGQHTGDVVFYDAQGRVDRVFPATGRPFEVDQVHFCRLRDGLVVEHWAVRDDLGQATQLGWIPPSPGYLWRCFRATRRARRNAR
ncbi:ester cyclase [Micropruina sonneratiae]|uniref:ester cyclase n=1 Tax=Micropruina sonneratiae TaxID=2986940 RepID=UPI0022264278|nr:ester cyclase [Micropruina sp. KQZ13P-5]MCW3157210.1 ester cyclase [Micropruina sp. KQZ13P-5]